MQISYDVTLFFRGNITVSGDALQLKEAEPGVDSGFCPLRLDTAQQTDL